MRILFVSTNLPIPPNSGQSIRSLSIIRALATSGHELAFVSFATTNRPRDLDPLSSYCVSIELLDREIRNLTLQPDYVQRLKSLVKFKCHSIERFRSAPMKQRIQERLARESWDLVLCDSIYALINIPETKVPILLNTHNVEYLILERYAYLQKDPIKKLYAIVESRLMYRAELKGCQKVVGGMVCSDSDRQIVRQLLPRLPVSVIPNVVDTESIKPGLRTDNVNRGPAILLFQGVMDWFPNRDAVEYFARTILPRVCQEAPEVKFVVAGRNPPPEFIALFGSQSKIEFTGTVPDMRPYLEAATIVVVPLRLGGGTRIKILEACAAAKPIISTSIGAEGLDLAPGKEIILADSPVDFASHVVDLLKNPARCERLAKSARRAVEDRYSPAVLRSTLDSVFAHIKESPNAV
jgi:polysaccharide biosynthesis protein PslH